ncbi:MAG TPA: circadian clock protein KaiC, partial [Chloroflexota bacterium]|nr:circadian clock protein KaiC [Chloroflexota bacterium]
FRVLSILKMRDSAYDSSIRQYVIDNRGFHVLNKIETAEGLLTGIARLNAEMRRRPGAGGRATDHAR